MRPLVHHYLGVLIAACSLMVAGSVGEAVLFGIGVNGTFDAISFVAGGLPLIALGLVCVDRPKMAITVALTAIPFNLLQTAALAWECWLGCYGRGYEEAAAFVQLTGVLLLFVGLGLLIVEATTLRRSGR